jgi:hypothetical protein
MSSFIVSALSRGTFGAIALALAVLPAAAQTQASPQLRAEAMTVMQLCRTDYDGLCAGVTPGGGRILACLQNHAGDLSPECAQAIPRAEALKVQAEQSGALPK